MTTPNTARKAGPLLGTGSQTVWPFAFKVFAASDVAVTIADSTGAEIALVLGTDFSVALNANQETSPGGTVTYPISGSALPVGSVLVIAGDVDYDQTLDIPSGGNFSPLALENQLDRTTMQIQQLKEAVDRAAKLPTTSSEDATALVADIVRLADSADNLDTVVANITNINTVASDLNEPVSEINTVAVSIVAVETVGANIANVNAVAGVSSDVTTVATNIASVNSAASNMAAIVAAPSEASAAAASAAAAAASAASGMYSSVQDKSADYTVVVGDAGDLIRMTTSGGARAVTLPAISTVPDGFNVTVVKWTGDANAVTVSRSGSDLINGSTSYVLDAHYKSATFVADAQTATWFASGSGSASTNIVVDPFVGTGAQTAFILSGAPGSETNTLVNVNGVFQLKSTYSLSGATVTFSSAPPNGALIEIQWSQPLAIGVPSDGTVSTGKLADGAVTSAKLADANITRAKAANDLLGVAQNTQSAGYTLALADVGKHVYSANTGAQTITIPTNASVAFEVGAAISLVNNGTTAITIGTTGITLKQAGTANTGNRTLGVNGLATVLKVGTDTWFITGAGLT